MSTTPTVAVIAPGNMGAGVGRRLTENKVTVLTSLAGRSEESVSRAREAGMQSTEERALAEADFLLSIVPPGDALSLATRLAPYLTAANRKLTYVECNAVSPPTMQKIADVIAKTGCAFVGAGIIGPPPKPGSTNTKIYVSGPAAKDVARLNDYGLIVRVLEGPLTAASALKMSYAEHDRFSWFGEPVAKVLSRAEATACAGNQQRTAALIGLCLVNGPAQCLVHRFVEGIELVGPVKRDDAIARTLIHKNGRFSRHDLRNRSSTSISSFPSSKSSAIRS